MDDETLECDVEVVGRRWEQRGGVHLGETSSSVSDAHEDWGFDVGGLASALPPYTRA